ncbi:MULTISPECIES: glycosyltransferase [Sorangium]|uniref:glycosyltransferase n=1 Tax=Sorangium TaxID=39643 RepID=UPI003D9C0E15
MPTEKPWEKRFDGAARKAAAQRIWETWHQQTHAVGLLVGFSGVGKSELALALRDGTIAEGRPAVCVEVPEPSADVEGVCKADLVEALRDRGDDRLAERVATETTLAGALRLLLRAGYFVALDEFQRTFRPEQAEPGERFVALVRKLAERPADSGFLLLVSNRDPAPSWTERVRVVQLLPPDEIADAVSIVLGALGAGNAAERFPEARQAEVTRRLGANPRALSFLGHLLRTFPLDDLLGSAEPEPSAPVDRQLVEEIERRLVTKAEVGLGDEVIAFLRDLSVLRVKAPRSLVQDMAGGAAASAGWLRGLVGRYLVSDSRGGYEVHPVVREVEAGRAVVDMPARLAAHRRAGLWYARAFGAALHPSATGHLGVAQQVAEAQYHLLAAGEKAAFQAALTPLRAHVERTYRHVTTDPDSPAERDARIDLLEAALVEPGAWGAEFHLAKLLFRRASGDDLARALVHAERATKAQDDGVPWVLWAKLVRAVRGLDAGVRAAEEATRAVHPNKSLYSVYQVLGANHAALGRVPEALKCLREGYERTTEKFRVRLIEQAIQFAASDSDSTLQSLLEWIRTTGNETEVALAEILLLQRKDRWREAAVRARQGRGLKPHNLHLALAEAMAWLGAADASEAQAALDSFPIRWRYEVRDANAWLAALVALLRGDAQRASYLLGCYLGELASTQIRRRLLYEWDTRVATLGEANPALNFPILPPTVTGLDRIVIRPQHGPPVLPERLTMPDPVTRPEEKRRASAAPAPLRVLAVATEWSSKHGGISTLNRHLCAALARAGAEVCCLVADFSEAEERVAKDVGVRLVKPRRRIGLPENALSQRPESLPFEKPDVILGHDRITGPHALSQREFFPDAPFVLLVHTAPDEIELGKSRTQEGDRARRAEERTHLLRQLAGEAALVLPVGPRLRQETELFLRGGSSKAPLVVELKPGLTVSQQQVAVPPDIHQIFVIGRVEDFELKGIDIAARAARKAMDEPGFPQRTRMRLVVRGVEPGQGAAIQEKLYALMGDRRVEVVPREYSVDPVLIRADLEGSSVALMPSRVEGFGLVGLEAIEAGIPVLLAERSGLAQALRLELGEDKARHHVVPATGKDESDVTAWAKFTARKLEDRERAFQLARILREDLTPRWSWDTTATDLCGHFTHLRDAHA